MKAYTISFVHCFIMHYAAHLHKVSILFDVSGLYYLFAICGILKFYFLITRVI